MVLHGPRTSTNKSLLQCRLCKVHQRLHLMLQLQCSALGILKLHSDLLLCLRDRAAPDLVEPFFFLVMSKI